MIGRYLKKEFIPSHDLAMSVRIHDRLPKIELDKEEALHYLHKEALDSAINKEGLTGWVLVTYGGVNLGWVKAMPNRINNYYPKEARIAVL
jgi:NOL1/NOP2/fmu family ribosome biogenesis protein